MSRLTTQFNDGCLVLRIEGRFSFDMLREFRTAYEPFLPTTIKIIIDLKQVEYMDSSSLGMLMSLHNACVPKGIPITLAHCCPNVREILTIVHFEQKFEIT